MSSRIRHVACALFLVFPLASWPTDGVPPPTVDHSDAREEVSTLLRRVFASVAEIDAWTRGYTSCCGCGSPVVLKRDDKEAVVIVCTRTSGMLTSETFVFDKHRGGYRFMLLRNLLYQDIKVSDEGDHILLAGKSPVLKIPWAGVGAE